MGGAFSLTHILIVLVVLVLLFGANKIPQLMRGLGSGVNEFKKGLAEGEEKKPEAAKPADKPAETPKG